MGQTLQVRFRRPHFILKSFPIAAGVRKISLDLPLGAEFVSANEEGEGYTLWALVPAEGRHPLGTRTILLVRGDEPFEAEWDTAGDVVYEGTRLEIREPLVSVIASWPDQTGRMFVLEVCDDEV